MNEFTKTIVEWYKENKRELPWRESADPYLIWISEIILQQTRVAQGYDYFLRFIKRFPDVRTLAAAEEDEVMKYWILLTCPQSSCRRQKHEWGFPGNVSGSAGSERSGGVYSGSDLFVCLRYALCGSGR